MTLTLTDGRRATRAVRNQAGTLGWTAALSGLINLLGLTAPLFMLQVYDRVLASGSLSTLAALVTLVAILFAAQSILERIRTRLFARIGVLVGHALGQLAFDAMVDSRSLQASGRLRDVDQVRSFLSGGGPAALFDLPWAPLYLLLLFLLHPLLGLIGLGGGLCLAALTWATDRTTGPLQKQHAAVKQHSQSIVDNVAAARETVRAMGMACALRDRWVGSAAAGHLMQLSNADAVSSYAGVAKFVRQFLQSVVLAAGAALIIAGDATGGCDDRVLNPAGKDACAYRPGHQSLAGMGRCATGTRSS
jgi:ATP-binding cassette subfamily C protein PrsD